MSLINALSPKDSYHKLSSILVMSQNVCIAQSSQLSSRTSSPSLSATSVKHCFGLGNTMRFVTTSASTSVKRTYISSRTRAEKDFNSLSLDIQSRPPDYFSSRSLLVANCWPKQRWPATSLMKGLKSGRYFSTRSDPPSYLTAEQSWKSPAERKTWPHMLHSERQHSSLPILLYREPAEILHRGTTTFRAHIVHCDGTRLAFLSRKPPPAWQSVLHSLQMLHLRTFGAVTQFINEQRFG